MMALLSGLWAKVGGWFTTVSAVVAAVGGVLLMARSGGITAEEETQSKAVMKESSEADNVQNQVAATAPDAQRDELHQWERG